MSPVVAAIPSVIFQLTFLGLILASGPIVIFLVAKDS
jgi:hypothetical protein